MRGRGRERRVGTEEEGVRGEGKLLQVGRGREARAWGRKGKGARSEGKLV